MPSVCVGLCVSTYARILITSVVTKITTHLQNQFDPTQQISIFHDDEKKIKVCFLSLYEAANS